MKGREDRVHVYNFEQDRIYVAIFRENNKTGIVEVLLVCNNVTSYRNIGLGLPGGGVGLQEGQIQAAEREVCEETGYTIEVTPQDLVLNEIHMIKRKESRRFIVLGKIIGGMIKKIPTEEIIMVRWLPVDYVLAENFHWNTTLWRRNGYPIIIRRANLHVGHRERIKKALVVYLRLQKEHNEKEELSPVDFTPSIAEQVSSPQEKTNTHTFFKFFSPLKKLISNLFFPKTQNER